MQPYIGNPRTATAECIGISQHACAEGHSMFYVLGWSACFFFSSSHSSSWFLYEAREIDGAGLRARTAQLPARHARACHAKGLSGTQNTHATPPYITHLHRDRVRR